MHERDLHQFLDVTLVYLNKLTGNELVVRDPTIEFQALVFSTVTGLLQVSGLAEGFVYLTATQNFLHHLQEARAGAAAASDATGHEMMQDLTSTIAQSLEKRFGSALHLSEPRVFSIVPDDPIEMPPAVYVLPMLWRNEHIFLVVGVSAPESPAPLPPA